MVNESSGNDQTSNGNREAMRGRNWAILCHAMTLSGFAVPLVGNILGPLLVWLVKKDEFPLVNDQGKEAMNFQILMTILYLLGVLLVTFLVGVLLLLGLGLFSLVMTLMAIYHTYRDGSFKYPITVRFLK